jgi:predicted secreted hydrolase
MLSAVPALAAIAQETAPGASDAPVPVAFPRDDGPHRNTIEWWYYTGHLKTERGDRYGFQFVIFKGERGGLVAYASHFAVTDAVRGAFRYDERLVVGAADEASVSGGGFDLQVGDWWMRGEDGEDRVVASMPGYAISLRLSGVKPPTLHGGDGFVPYGSGQWTYYYSRTRLEVAGALAVDGETFAVTGLAWMDHQWGEFTTWADGGWDWFAVHLDDGWDLMLYRILAPDGLPEILHGSLVAPDGELVLLGSEDFSATATGTWTSPETGTTYPSGWSIEVPAAELALALTPTLLDQELDTSVTTGQIYWEGEVTIEGTRAGQDIGGLGYVELTGYADRSGVAPAANSQATPVLGR